MGSTTTSGTLSSSQDVNSGRPPAYFSSGGYGVESSPQFGGFARDDRSTLLTIPTGVVAVRSRDYPVARLLVPA